MKARVDYRLPTMLGIVCLIVILGALVSGLPGGGVEVATETGQPYPAADGSPSDHVVARLFRQGAAMLHVNRHDLASVALHRLLQIAPALPEAHVNMGFAQLGLGRPAVAEDFFRTAIELRAGQRNAYYGLAMALEAQRDFAAARGAMRTYLHLSPRDDPYSRKAQAALWEWSSTAGGPEESVRPLPGDAVTRENPASVGTMGSGVAE